MSVNEKMTAIADAIREKTGGTDTLTLDGMAEAISRLKVEELLAHADIPDYVKEATLALANKVSDVRTDESIVFLAMSDTHQYGDQQYSDTTADANGVQTNTSNLHAAMAAKILAYAMDFDFMAHLGDAAWGGSGTTSPLLQSQVDDMLGWLGEAHKGIPCFHAIGNHDTGIYYHEQMLEDGETGVYTETGEYLYKTLTALSASEDTVFGDSTNGGYCYRDFADKKLRVFLLNTSEKLVNAQKDQGTYGAQRVWFANALWDLNQKSDAADWGFIVLSHYPADYGATMPLSELLKAYVEGTTFNIKDPVSSYYVGDDTIVGVNFSGCNSAKFIAQFHGHTHNFLYSKLYSYATGSGVQYDAWRVAIPNGQYNRENYYSTVGSYTDISFAQDTSYSKTANTAKDTSFVVNVINPSEEKIYSFCYGAGYDRAIGYAATVYYSVTANLTNVTLDKSILSVEAGASYTNSITVDDGYDLQSVTVTMDGVDITATAYSDDIISISEVTGDIVITATAIAITSYTNQLPISTDAAGAVYNSTGYKADTYLSGGAEGARTGVYCTGFIPIPGHCTLYFKNCGIQASQSNHRFAVYDATKTFITNGQANTTQLASLTGVTMEFDADGYMTKMVREDAYANQGAYIRFCCGYLGADSVVTVNEPIS